MDRSAEVELAALRRMSAEEKLAVMHGLWQTAWQLSAAGVRGRHPDWPEARVEAEVRALFSRDHA